MKVARITLSQRLNLWIQKQLKQWLCTARQ